ncbi:anti-sigma factor family protein [Azospirillum sp. ST 5-10]|uniref:anti-sigma factor family protein n=1 Tax=unclassified Azospirillum TaxID=2630922 RepID=UPI003F4A312E
MNEQTPIMSRQHLDDYVAGKLDAASVELVEAYLADNPEVATKIRQDQAVRERLRKMFAPVLAEPIPERLLEILRSVRVRISRSGRS